MWNDLLIAGIRSVYAKLLVFKVHRVKLQHANSPDLLLLPGFGEIFCYVAGVFEEASVNKLR